MSDLDLPKDDERIAWMRRELGDFDRNKELVGAVAEEFGIEDGLSRYGAAEELLELSLGRPLSGRDEIGFLLGVVVARKKIEYQKGVEG